MRHHLSKRPPGRRPARPGSAASLRGKESRPPTGCIDGPANTAALERACGRIGARGPCTRCGYSAPLASVRLPNKKSRVAKAADRGSPEKFSAGAGRRGAEKRTREERRFLSFRCLWWPIAAPRPLPLFPCCPLRERVRRRGASPSNHSCRVRSESAGQSLRAKSQAPLPRRDRDPRRMVVTGSSGSFWLVSRPLRLLLRGARHQEHPQKIAPLAAQGAGFFFLFLATSSTNRVRHLPSAFCSPSPEASISRDRPQSWNLCRGMEMVRERSLDEPRDLGLAVELRAYEPTDRRRSFSCRVLPLCSHSSCTRLPKTTSVAGPPLSFFVATPVQQATCE